MNRDKVIVVMGVSGCGKSTVGRVLAARLGFTFLDADDYHPQENILKMQAGVPLTDEDRAPWLLRLVHQLTEEAGKNSGVVLACSALKGSYRRLLSSGKVIPRFVFLKGSKDLIAARMADREGHFMPESLLDNQFDTLEVPTAAICVDVSDPVEKVVDHIEESLTVAAYHW